MRIIAATCLWVCATACLAADDWPVFRGNALGTGVAAAKLPDELDVLWKFSVEKGSFEATAVIADSTVFIGDMDGRFYALDLATGQKKWVFTSAPEGKSAAGINTAAGYRQGLVYFGDVDGVFFCLDAKTGEKKWSLNTEAEINSAPNFHKDLVLFGSQNATLYALDAKSGEQKWSYTIGDQVRCSPTVVQNRCFLAGCDGELHVVDVDNGKLLGKTAIDSPTGSMPAAVGERIFFGTEGAEFLAVNWKGPEIAWRFKDKDPGKQQAFRSSAAALPDLIIVGGRDRVLHAFDPESGERKWKFTAKNRIDSSPVVVGERVFFGAADGRIYAVNKTTGKEMWRYEAGGSVVASPAVVDGKLVIASDARNAGIVYCFGKK